MPLVECVKKNVPKKRACCIFRRTCKKRGEQAANSSNIRPILFNIYNAFRIMLAKCGEHPRTCYARTKLPGSKHTWKPSQRRNSRAQPENELSEGRAKQHFNANRVILENYILNQKNEFDN